MAELYGKQEGCSHGYGGSMHLYDVERGNLGANAVVGGGLPAIVGAALAFKLRGEPRVAVAFFGDGATNIGTFHESLNLAQLWKVPARLRLENNKWAESTPGWQHSPIWDDMSEAREGVRHEVDEGRRPGRRGGVQEGRARRSSTRAPAQGPVFLDVETCRLHGHYIGDPQVYRSKEQAHEAARDARPDRAAAREARGLATRNGRRSTPR